MRTEGRTRVFTANIVKINATTNDKLHVAPAALQGAGGDDIAEEPWNWTGP